MSIVTPTFNSPRFLAETIESVLNQDYPRIEHIVVDGGSDEETARIATRYGARISYFREKDRGAADAINNGFSRSRGGILGWLSSDDTYLPGAVSKAISGFVSNHGASVVYGGGRWTDESGSILGTYPVRSPFNPQDLERECPICQPAAFFRRDAFELAGRLDATLHSAFDYDLWVRLCKRGERFVAVPDVLATSRMHRNNKSLGEKRTMFRENIGLLRQHYRYVPPSWVYGYVCFLRDGRDQFFEPLQTSATAWIASLFAGIWFNGAQSPRYLREWLSLVLRGASKRVGASRSQL